MKMKISYSCDDLIEEINEDIEIFGDNHECYVFFENISSILFISDYYPVDEDDKELQLEHIEKEKRSYGKCTLGDALKLMETQNNIFCTKEKYMNEFSKVFVEI